jgi:hypothetical protein
MSQISSAARAGCTISASVLEICLPAISIMFHLRFEFDIKKQKRLGNRFLGTRAPLV